MINLKRDNDKLLLDKEYDEETTQKIVDVANHISKYLKYDSSKTITIFEHTNEEITDRDKLIIYSDRSYSFVRRMCDVHKHLAYSYVTFYNEFNDGPFKVLFNHECGFCYLEPISQTIQIEYNGKYYPRFEFLDSFRDIGFEVIVVDNEGNIIEDYKSLISNGNYIKYEDRDKYHIEFTYRFRTTKSARK